MEPGPAAGFYASVVADVDLDGNQEIIAGNTIFNAQGGITCSKTAIPDGITAVGNFDDGPLSGDRSRVALLSEPGRRQDISPGS